MNYGEVPTAANVTPGGLSLVAIPAGLPSLILGEVRP